MSQKQEEQSKIKDIIEDKISTQNFDIEKVAWNTIDRFFKDNPDIHAKHHLDSYNRFFNENLKEVLKTRNPLKYFVEALESDAFKSETGEEITHKYSLEIYFGGKSGERIYYGKPILYDPTNNNRKHYLYPNEARLKNITYGFPIHYDIEIDFKYVDDDGQLIQSSELISKSYLGTSPLMVRSDLCLLKGLSTEARYNLGEDKSDRGGYFIIDGKEKAIVSQETRANNVLYVLEDSNDDYLYSAEIKSVSEDASKPTRTLAVKLVAEKPSYTNMQIVVKVPNVRKPVPLFILMRALGVESDREIIQTCLIDMEANKSMLELFRPSVHDAGYIFTQSAALKYIASFTKRQTTTYALHLLMDYLLPHMGELNFKSKAYYLGYMVRKLLFVHMKMEPPTNRDKYSFKRIEVAGNLIYQLFVEYYNLQTKFIYSKIDEEYFWHKSDYKNEKFINVVMNKQKLVFGNRVVEEGFRKAFKGNWGSQPHTKRPGIVQDLNRLSFFSATCQLRKTNLYISSAGAKVVNPRLLSPTQWGLLCPIHSPDGGNVGLHKHLSTSTHITSGCSMKPIVEYLLHPQMNVKPLEECTFDFLALSSKVFINGTWIGNTYKPLDLLERFKLHRRNNMINIFTSIRFDYRNKEIIIFCDAGRPTRPLFYITDGAVSFSRQSVISAILDKKIHWKKYIYGLNYKETELRKENVVNVPWTDNYWEKQTNILKRNSAVIDYVDTQESESSLLATNEVRKQLTLTNVRNITHFEIHPSFGVLGFMANQIIFPENNPYPRNAFSCGQAKQGVSMFHTNFKTRVDKTTYLLNTGQTPLTKSRYYDYITDSRHPYGVNAIVAVMCYSGYNVEDAVIMNGGSLLRGMFRTSYYNMYETHEENSRNSKHSTTDKIIMSILNNPVTDLKQGYDYSLLDEETGLIKEGSVVTEKTVLIGKVIYVPGEDMYTDDSVVPKKGQVGIVDKAYITDGEEGTRVAKIKIRAQRIPQIGDKFCSRAGQKGTIGIVLSEADMPTTEEGIRPDIIVNPHAMPSRMTIGHLVESLLSKTGTLYGGYGDCTAFVNTGPKQEVFGKMLTKYGYHSSGCEILYNGMTGEQIKTDIYFGPTFYLRLKHMPKDKINYRGRGPRTVLTRQTVQGRANNGGLRIGEMDRDCLIAHGMTRFISDSMMVRGDEFYMAVCNQTGSVAIYNERKNIFLSPMLDGPLKFNYNLDNEMNVNAVSKYGKDFSVVRVPYAFKLLMQELLTMNVQMRIITEKNVDMLTGLTENTSAVKLGGMDIKALLNDISDKKTEGLQDKKIEEIKREIDKDMMGQVDPDVKKSELELEENAEETKEQTIQNKPEDTAAFNVGEYVKFISDDVDGYIDGVFEILSIDGTELALRNIENDDYEWVDAEMDLVKTDDEGNVIDYMGLEEEARAPLVITDDAVDESIVDDIGQLDVEDLKREVTEDGQKQTTIKIKQDIPKEGLETLSIQPEQQLEELEEKQEEEEIEQSKGRKSIVVGNVNM